MSASDLVPIGDAGANLDPTGDVQAELAYLRNINSEYRVMMQVLACVVERCLTAEEVGSLMITDEQIAESPDLIAHRDQARRRITLTATRG